MKFLSNLGFIAFITLSGATAISSSGEFDTTFVSPSGEFKMSHSPTLAELPGNELMACWYAGTEEGASDVQIYCRTKAFKSPAWSPPTVAVAHNEMTQGNLLRNNTLGNPVLYFGDDQTLYLFYVVRTFGGWVTSEVAYKSSQNGGLSWSEGVILEGRFERAGLGSANIGKLTRALPIKLGPGRILLPLYYELSKIGYTCDLTLDHGSITKGSCLDIPGSDHLQPSLVQHKQKIYAYLRSYGRDRIKWAEMDLTDGYSSTAQWKINSPLDLPNPNSSVAANNTRDDNILLVYNSANNRQILKLGLSSDGEHFTELTTLEDGTGDPLSGFSYPTLFKDSLGVFHLVYTFHDRDAIKHVQFTEKWIREHKHRF